MEDKRIFARIQAKFPVKFNRLEDGQQGKAYTQDVSAEGVGLVSNEQLAPHLHLEMWLEFPDQGEPLYVKGEVIWSKIITADEYRAGTNLEKVDLMGMARVLRPKPEV